MPAHAILQRSAVPAAAPVRAPTPHKAATSHRPTHRANALSRQLQRAMAMGVQTQMLVSTPADPAELEADATARHVMRMEPPDTHEKKAPAASARRNPRRRQHSAMPRVLARRGHQVAAPSLARKPARAADPLHADPDVEADIHASLDGGMTLPANVRAFMEPRFAADLSGVRIHTDAKAASLAARLSARAFAYDSHVFSVAANTSPTARAAKSCLRMS